MVKLILVLCILAYFVYLSDADFEQGGGDGGHGGGGHGGGGAYGPPPQPYGPPRPAYGPPQMCSSGKGEKGGFEKIKQLFKNLFKKGNKGGGYGGGGGYQQPQYGPPPGGYGHGKRR